MYFIYKGFTFCCDHQAMDQYHKIKTITRLFLKEAFSN